MERRGFLARVFGAAAAVATGHRLEAKGADYLEKVGGDYLPGTIRYDEKTEPWCKTEEKLFLSSGLFSSTKNEQ